MLQQVLVEFADRPAFVIPGGLWAVLGEKLEAADVRNSGRAMRQLLEFLQFSLGLNYRQSMLICRRLRPTVDAERFEELCLLADLVESFEGGA